MPKTPAGRYLPRPESTQKFPENRSGTRTATGFLLQCMRGNYAGVTVLARYSGTRHDRKVWKKLQAGKPMAGRIERVLARAAIQDGWERAACRMEY